MKITKSTVQLQVILSSKVKQMNDDTRGVALNYKAQQLMSLPRHSPTWNYYQARENTLASNSVRNFLKWGIATPTRLNSIEERLYSLLHQSNPLLKLLPGRG